MRIINENPERQLHAVSNSLENILLRFFSRKYRNLMKHNVWFQYLVNFFITTVVMYVTVRLPQLIKTLRDKVDTVWDFFFKRRIPRSPKNEVMLVYNGEMDVAKNNIKAPFQLNAWIDMITKLVEKDELRPFTDKDEGQLWIWSVFRWTGLLRSQRTDLETKSQLKDFSTRVRRLLFLTNTQRRNRDKDHLWIPYQEEKFWVDPWTYCFLIIGDKEDQPRDRELDGDGGRRVRRRRRGRDRDRSEDESSDEDERYRAEKFLKWKQKVTKNIALHINSLHRKGYNYLLQLDKTVVERYEKNLRQSLTKQSHIFEFEDGDLDCDSLGRGLYWKKCEFSSTRKFAHIWFDQKETFLNAYRKFLHQKDYYERVGDPYTFNCLMYGVPGCGKTSVLKACINEDLERGVISHLFIVNFTKIKSIEQFWAIMFGTRFNGHHIDQENRIIVFEDFDASKGAEVFKIRDELKEQNNDEGSGKLKAGNKAQNILNQQTLFLTLLASKQKKEQKALWAGFDEGENDNGKSDVKLELTDILNIIDGLNERTGARVFWTTNLYPPEEHFDPAFLRPGRMDVILHLRKCSHLVIRGIINYYFETQDSNAEYTSVGGGVQKSRDEKLSSYEVDREEFDENLKRVSEYKFTPAQVKQICKESQNMVDAVKNLLKLQHNQKQKLLKDKLGFLKKPKLLRQDGLEMSSMTRMRSGHQTPHSTNGDDVASPSAFETPLQYEDYSKWTNREVALWIASLGNNESVEFNDYARRFYDCGISGNLLKHLNYKTICTTLKIVPPFSFEILCARDKLLGITEEVDYSEHASPEDYMSKAELLEKQRRRRRRRRGDVSDSSDRRDRRHRRRYDDY